MGLGSHNPTTGSLMLFVAKIVPSGNGPKTGKQLLVGGFTPSEKY